MEILPLGYQTFSEKIVFYLVLTIYTYCFISSTPSSADLRVTLVSSCKFFRLQNIITHQYGQNQLIFCFLDPPVYCSLKQVGKNPRNTK